MKVVSPGIFTSGSPTERLRGNILSVPYVVFNFCIPLNIDIGHNIWATLYVLLLSGILGEK